MSLPLTNDEKIKTLVNEMGFSADEASMALRETGGDMEMAINKILAGECAPPPYTEIDPRPSKQAATTSE